MPWTLSSSLSLTWSSTIKIWHSTLALHALASLTEDLRWLSPTTSSSHALTNLLRTRWKEQLSQFLRHGKAITPRHSLSQLSALCCRNQIKKWWEHWTTRQWPWRWWASIYLPRANSSPPRPLATEASSPLAQRNSHLFEVWRHQLLKMVVDSFISLLKVTF